LSYWNTKFKLDCLLRISLFLLYKPSTTPPISPPISIGRPLGLPIEIGGVRRGAAVDLWRSCGGT